MLHRIPSTAKVKAEIGWKPQRSLDDILADVLAFERDRVEATA
jgi:nucleoside-diphosphate-sugar epimerase